MNDAIRRYGGLFGGVVVAGLVGGKAAGWMIGDRAVAGPLLLLGDARTAAAAIATTVALTIVAIVVARMVNSAVGIFVMGCGLGALAMRCGTVRDLVFGAVPTTRMALETLCWAALIGIAVAAIFALGGHLTDVAPAPAAGGGLRAGIGSTSRLAGDSSPRRALSPRLALVAAAALMVPVTWVVLRNDLKGQSIAAATVGGLVVGLFARLWSPHTQPRFATAAAIAALGVAQLAMARLMRGPALDLFIQGNWPRVLAAMPVDVAAGALAGTALGLGWARSFMPEPAAAAGPHGERHDDGRATPRGAPAPSAASAPGV